MLKTGDTFTGTRTTRRNGYPETGSTQVTVIEIIDGYTDVWTGRRYRFGVSFTLADSLDERTSTCSLPYDDFMRIWAR